MLSIHTYMWNNNTLFTSCRRRLSSLVSARRCPLALDVACRRLSPLVASRRCTSPLFASRRHMLLIVGVRCCPSPLSPFVVVGRRSGFCICSLLKYSGVLPFWRRAISWPSAGMCFSGHNIKNLKRRPPRLNCSVQWRSRCDAVVWRALGLLHCMYGKAI